MGRLFNIALKNKSHRVLLYVTVLAMCLLTFASQLEIFALGVITKKGPDFFELFAPVQEGKLTKTGEVSKRMLEARWQEIDKEKKGLISSADTAAYLSQWRSKNFIDSWMNRLDATFGVSQNVFRLALLLFCVAVFKAISMFIYRFNARLISIRISYSLRQEYFEHIQSLPMSFYQKYNMGSLSSRVVGDSVLIAEAVNACLVNYLQTPFVLATTFALCVLASWKLSLLIFGGIPLLLFPIIFLAKRVKKISKQIQQSQERFAAVLIDFLAGIQTVKAFAMEDFSLRKYREHNKRMALLEKKSARYDLSTRPIVHTIGMFFLSFSLIYGLYILHMSVSELLFFCGLLYVFYEPIKKFAEENTHIQRGVAAAERMWEVMELKPQITDKKDAVDFQRIEDSIEFNDVWFQYGEDWVLKGLSFKIKKGEVTAIVGPTGSGKSTIAQLLPRLYEAQKGEIRIDGKPLEDYTQKSLRENIAFIPQKPFLFLDTIAENISFGKNFTLEQIKDAADRAHASEFIERLPQGYQTELDETGKNLSGGQQQRLAIARALVKRAPILIMDEATSALDTISENRIKTTMQELRGQLTQIVIAHRLSTIEDADKIIYIENGEKAAEGTKEELLQSCPGFRQMWEAIRHANERKRAP